MTARILKMDNHVREELLECRRAANCGADPDHPARETRRITAYGSLPRVAHPASVDNAWRRFTVLRCILPSS